VDPSAWRVEVSEPARRQIERLPERDRRRVLDNIDDLRSGTARIELFGTWS
jgi:mRNA-degrading endonuclease RelE of RelBE toxin-antitoxin system